MAYPIKENQTPSSDSWLGWKREYQSELAGKMSAVAKNPPDQPYAQTQEQKSWWNDTKTGRTLSWIGDKTQRFNYTVANLALDMVDGEEFHPITSMWRGLSGKDKTVFSDVLKEKGVNGMTAMVGGLALDIMLDPLNLLSGAGLFGKIDKISDVIRMAGKFDKVDDVTKNLAKLDNFWMTKKGANELEALVKTAKASGVDNFGQVARNQFVKKFVVPHLDVKTGNYGKGLSNILVKPGIQADISWLPRQLGKFGVPGSTWQKTLLPFDVIQKPLSKVTTKLGNWFDAVKTSTIEAQAIGKSPGWVGEAVMYSDVGMKIAKKALQYRYGQSAGTKIVDEARQIAIRTSQRKALELGEKLTKVAPELQQTVFKALTGEAKLIKGLPDDIAKLTTEARQLVDGLGQQLVKAGLLSEQVYKKGSGSYLPTLYKTFELGDGADFGKKLASAIAKTTGVKMPKSALYRLAKKSTLEELGETQLKFEKYKKVKGGGWRKGKETFNFSKEEMIDFGEAFQKRAGKIEQPGYLVAKAITDMSALLEQQKMINYLRKFSAKTVKEAEALVKSGKWLRAGKNYMDKSGNMFNFVGTDKKIFRELAETVLPSAEHALVKGVFEQTGKGIKIWDQMLNFWKAGKTVWNPGMLMRNFYNNFVLNDMGGVSAIKDWNKYKRAAMALLGKGDDIDIKLLEEAKAAGMMMGEFVDTELKGMLLNSLKSSNDVAGFVSSMGRNLKKVGRAGSQFMQLSEEWGKFTHVLTKIDNGMTMQQAVASAHKYLINYQALTNFEKGFVKRVMMPFYTYPRKIIPVVLETAITNPKAINKYNKVAEAIESISEDEEYREEYMPEWMKNRFMVRMPFKDSDGNLLYFDMAYILPYGDADDWFNLDPDAFSLLKNLNPIIKEIIQQQTNYDAFTKGQIVREGTPPLETKRIQALHWARTLAPAVGEAAFQIGEAAVDRKRWSGNDIETFLLQTAISKILGLKFVPLREDETVPGQFGKYRSQLSSKYYYLSNFLSNPSYSDKAKEGMREQVTNDIEKLQQDFIKSR